LIDIVLVALQSENNESAYLGSIRMVLDILLMIAFYLEHRLIWDYFYHYETIRIRSESPKITESKKSPEQSQIRHSEKSIIKISLKIP